MAIYDLRTPQQPHPLAQGLVAFLQARRAKKQQEMEQEKFGLDKQLAQARIQDMQTPDYGPVQVAGEGGPYPEGSTFQVSKSGKYNPINRAETPDERQARLQRSMAWNKYIMDDETQPQNLREMARIQYDAAARQLYPAPQSTGPTPRTKPLIEGEPIEQALTSPPTTGPTPRTKPLIEGEPIPYDYGRLADQWLAEPPQFSQGMIPQSPAAPPATAPGIRGKLAQILAANKMARPQAELGPMGIADVLAEPSGANYSTYGGRQQALGTPENIKTGVQKPTSPASTDSFPQDVWKKLEGKKAPDGTPLQEVISAALSEGYTVEQLVNSKLVQDALRSK